MKKPNNSDTCLLNNPDQSLLLEPINYIEKINANLKINNNKFKKLRSIYLLKASDTTEQEFKQIVENGSKRVFLKTGKVLFYVSNHIAKVVYARGLSCNSIIKIYQQHLQNNTFQIYRKLQAFKVKSCLDCKQVEQSENVFGKAKKVKEQTININGSRYNWIKYVLKNNYKISVIATQSSSFSSKDNHCFNYTQQQILSIIQQYKNIQAEYPNLSEAEISQKIEQNLLNQLNSEKEIQPLVNEDQQQTECLWRHLKFQKTQKCGCVTRARKTQLKQFQDLRSENICGTCRKANK
ncbi:hypothetical protein ABPG72_011174 [Tetrahymena utriculariae]